MPRKRKGAGLYAQEEEWSRSVCLRRGKEQVCMPRKRKGADLNCLGRGKEQVCMPRKRKGAGLNVKEEERSRSVCLERGRSRSVCLGRGKEQVCMPRKRKGAGLYA